MMFIMLEILLGQVFTVSTPGDHGVIMIDDVEVFIVVIAMSPSAIAIAASVKDSVEKINYVTLRNGKESPWLAILKSRVLITLLERIGDNCRLAITKTAA